MKGIFQVWSSIERLYYLSDSRNHMHIKRNPTRWLYWWPWPISESYLTFCWWRHSIFLCHTWSQVATSLYWCSCFLGPNWRTSHPARLSPSLVSTTPLWSHTMPSGVFAPLLSTGSSKDAPSCYCLYPSSYEDVEVDRPRIGFCGMLPETSLEVDVNSENGFWHVLRPYPLIYKMITTDLIRCIVEVCISVWSKGKMSLGGYGQFWVQFHCLLVIAISFPGFPWKILLISHFWFFPKISRGDFFYTIFKSTFFFILKTWMTFASHPVPPAFGASSIFHDYSEVSGNPSGLYCWDSNI